MRSARQLVLELPAQWGWQDVLIWADLFIIGLLGPTQEDCTGYWGGPLNLHWCSTYLQDEMIPIKCAARYLSWSWGFEAPKRQGSICHA